MNEKQIMDAINMLAMSQGFYGRLREAIEDNHKIMDELVAQKFGDVVDMVLYLES